jgi:hypothetical protein
MVDDKERGQDAARASGAETPVRRRLRAFGCPRSNAEL